MGVFNIKEGRYKKAGIEVAKFISEEEFYRQAVILELFWLYHIYHIKANGSRVDFSVRHNESVRFKSSIDALIDRVRNPDWWMESKETIKKMEKQYNHDIVAIQYYTIDLVLGEHINPNLVHWGLTSQDIVNTVHTKNVQRLVLESLVPNLRVLIRDMKGFYRNENTDSRGFKLPARTHGQKAVAYSNENLLSQYTYRIEPILARMLDINPSVKFGNGAVGNYNHVTSMSDQMSDYVRMCINTVNSFFNDMGGAKRPNVQLSGTSQNNNYPYILDIIYELHKLLHVLLDMVQDMWIYAMLGYIKKPSILEEHGSSTMPQKSNPIEFENAEGNIKMAISNCEMFMKNLPISRLQRDLSDITIIRNLDTLFCYVTQSMMSISKGVKKFNWDADFLDKKVEDSWELHLENIQLIEKLHVNGWTYEEVKARIYNSETLKHYYNEREARWNADASTKRNT